ncbi:27964_t:CDS:2, partial [Gigaspora margarita]
MPGSTNLKQRSKKVSEAKDNNTSYDKAVKNNDTMGIIKRLQAATKKYDNNTDLKDYDDDNLFAHKADEIELNDDEKQLKEVNKNNDIGGLSEDEIEIQYCILELCGKAKGLKEVLKERELWPEKGLRLKEVQELMSQQPDFLAQKGQLEEIIVAA